MPHLALVEDYSDGVSAVLAGDRTLPAPSLVEDASGVRLLLLADAGPLPARVWAAAHAAGAAALVAPAGGAWAFLTVEEFIEGRREDPSAATLLVERWRPCAEDDLAYVRLMGLLDQPQPAPDQGRFVNLHCHSEFSALDGLSRTREMVEAAVADGQRALAVTDHGVCSGHPDLQRECDAAGIKPIFGMEAYLVDDRHRRPREWTAEERAEEGWREREEQDRREARDYRHLCLWAMDDQGLRNLWAMSTEAYREGHYYKPRLDWDTLSRLGEGVIASTACLSGPLSAPLLRDDVGAARQALGRLLAVFGDRLYVELHTNHLPEQVEVNRRLVALAREHRLPLLAVADSHYACREDQPVHRAWLAVQTNKDITEDSSLFAGGQDYHMPTADEVAGALAYLGPDVVQEALASTVSLAARCSTRIQGATATPIFTRPSAQHPDEGSRVARDVERLLDLCLSNWHRVQGKAAPEGAYLDRFEREMDLLVSAKFCGYFLMVADYAGWAKDQGILVGPGRGSGGASLVGYLARIIEIDPVEADLPFERFINEGRVELPDFDVDFPMSKRSAMKAYVTERWGADHVISIGTHVRLQSKGALNDCLRVLRPTLEHVHEPDFIALRAAIDEADAPLAGKHLPWEDFCAQFADLVDPLRARYPSVLGMVDSVVGRLKTYGKHPAGVVVSTDRPLTDLPLRVDVDGNMISQFDMDALASLGYVKFDILTLRTLDTIQEAVDLVQAQHGRRVDVYSWKEEYADPQVWGELSGGNTLGVFQIETRLGTRMTRRVKPASVDDLATVITLGRPGPLRSGLVETYLRRRAGEEPVTFSDPRLERALGRSYGTIIYQEDVMAVCQLLAGYTLTEADGVRKILGKKLVERVAKAGEEFLSRAVEHQTEPAVAASTWEQMAEFSKYSFNRAHAYGYAVLGYWLAWIKSHYPAQFLVAALSTVKDERVPEFVGEARRMGYAVLPPDVNASGVSFTAQGVSVRYGLESVKGVGEDTARYVVERQPFASVEDFEERCLGQGSRVNRGHYATLVAVGALDSLFPNRRALEARLEAEASGATKTCAHVDRSVVGPHGLPCSFDWAAEPDPPMVPRGRGKAKTMVAKPPPKACNVRCRQYRRPDPIDPASILPYTDADVRDRERALLGVWLSSSPFDRVPPDVEEQLMTASDVEEAAPHSGDLMVAFIVDSVRERLDRNGNKMAFVSMGLRTGALDAVVFSRAYEQHRQDLRPNRLCLGLLSKSERGLQLLEVVPT